MAELFRAGFDFGDGVLTGTPGRRRPRLTARASLPNIIEPPPYRALRCTTISTPGQWRRAKIAIASLATSRFYSIQPHDSDGARRFYATKTLHEAIPALFCADISEATQEEFALGAMRRDQPPDASTQRR
jgi:hypothetical protein